MIKSWGDYLRATKIASEKADEIVFKNRTEITVGSSLYYKWLELYDSFMEELYAN